MNNRKRESREREAVQRWEREWRERERVTVCMCVCVYVWTVWLLSELLFAIYLLFTYRLMITATYYLVYEWGGHCRQEKEKAGK